MSFLTRLLRNKPSEGLEVDFDRQVNLPNGATRILWHKPSGKGRVFLRPEHLRVCLMPSGVTYLEYMDMHPSAVFGDALILDALLAPYRAGKKGLIEELFKNFTGQIFFLGTAFEGVYEGRATTCFAYLNWRTHQSAMRYICPANHPVNDDVNCCALHIDLPPTIAS